MGVHHQLPDYQQAMHPLDETSYPEIGYYMLDVKINDYLSKQNTASVPRQRSEQAIKALQTDYTFVLQGFMQGLGIQAKYD